MYLMNYLNYMKNEGKSENTIIAYQHDIGQMLDYINKDETAITLTDLEGWKGSMDYASASKERKIRAVRSYFVYLVDHGYIDANPAVKLKGVRVENKTKQPLTADELRAMISNTTNRRNKSIIMMLAQTGMRISELLNMTIKQYMSRDTNNVISIVGKGNKTRKIGIAQEVCDVIDDYIINERNKDAQSKASPWLFVSNWHTQLDGDNVGHMLKVTAKKAGIDRADKISPHWLRTTCFTMQAVNGVPVPVIQQMAGHSNIETTMRYVRISDNVATNEMARMKF